jgi:hypothetical protein
MKILFFKKLDAYLHKDKKLAKDVKILAIIFGTLQVAATGAGAYIGVASAATLPGMIGLGALGFAAGNIAGGIVGGIALASLVAIKMRKAKKAAAKKTPAGPGSSFATGTPKLPAQQLKAGFDAANQNQPAKAAPVTPKRKHKFGFGR